MLWFNLFKRFFTRQWQVMIHDLQVFSEKPLSTEELTEILIPSSIPSINFYALLALATIIATCGLLANNAVTIVGAMIVAPLMNPIVSLSYGIITLNPYLIKRAIFTLITGIILVLILSFFSAHWLTSRVVGNQILARVEPNLLDLGVAIASGAAASLAYARRNISNALPGVAIAVALVPPLCVTGIGLALGQNAIVDIGLYFGRVYQDLNLAGGSFLLFLTNLVGIIFCGGLVFLFQGYGNIKQDFISLFLIFLIIVTVCFPLNSQLQNFLLKNKVVESLDKFAYVHFQEKRWVDYATSTIDIYVENRDSEIFILLSLLIPKNEISQSDVNELQAFLSNELNKTVKLEVYLVPFEILKK